MAVNDEVGRRWDCVLNGRGLMLDTRPARPEWQYRRFVTELTAPRLNQGNEMVDSIDGYWYVQFFSLEGGDGQEFYGRPDSTNNRFFEGHGVAPFRTPGRVGFYPVEETLYTAGGASSTRHENIKAIPAYQTNDPDIKADAVYIVSSDRANITIIYFNDGPDIWDFDVMAGSATIFDLTNGLGSGQTPVWVQSPDDDNYNVYEHPSGTPIFTKAAGTDKAVSALIDTVASRYALSYSIDNVTTWTTLAEDGSEEEVNGRVNIVDGLVGNTVEGDGYLHFGAAFRDRFEVWSWQIGTTDAPFRSLIITRPLEAINFNETWVPDLAWLQGSLYMATATGFYRAPFENGRFSTYLTIDTYEDGVADHHPWARNIGLEVWYNMGDGELAQYSPVYGGRNKMGSTVEVSYISDSNVLWSEYGLLHFSGNLLRGFDTGITQGEIVWSWIDMGTLRPKRFDSLQLVIENESIGGVDFFYRTEDVDWTELTMDADFAAVVGVTARQIQFKLVVSGEPDLSIFGLQVKLHDVAEFDTIIQLPINCNDDQATANSGAIVSRTGRGYELYRWLLDQVGQVLSFRDFNVRGGDTVDDPYDQEEFVEVRQVEPLFTRIDKTASYDRVRVNGTVLVTLRKVPG